MAPSAPLGTTPLLLFLKLLSNCRYITRKCVCMYIIFSVYFKLKTSLLSGKLRNSSIRYLLWVLNWILVHLLLDKNFNFLHVIGRWIVFRRSGDNREFHSLSILPNYVIHISAKSWFRSETDQPFKDNIPCGLSMIYSLRPSKRLPRWVSCTLCGMGFRWVFSYTSLTDHTVCAVKMVENGTMY